MVRMGRMGQNPVAAMVRMGLEIARGGPAGAGREGQNPVAAMVNMGLKRAFPQGAGTECEHPMAAMMRTVFGGPHCGHEGGPPDWKQLLPILRQALRSTQERAMLAPLMAKSLPQLITHVVANAVDVDRKIREHMEELRPAIEITRALAASTPGLEECEAKLDEMLAYGYCSPSEALLALLTAVGALPFQAQVVFFETFCALQEEWLFSFVESACAPSEEGPEVRAEGRNLPEAKRRRRRLAQGASGRLPARAGGGGSGACCAR